MSGRSSPWRFSRITCTCMLVRHYRVYRKKGHWLSQGAGERIEDSTGRTLLHAHSRDAAQQAFYKACKTARTQRQQGDADDHYPHRRKRWRTTVWKNTGIRCKAGVLRLARCRGHAPVSVVLPPSLAALAARCFVE